MTYLLDTHVFLWWVMQSPRLSPKAFALCQDEKNSLKLSITSVWEIQIKEQLGKLRLPARLAEIVETQRDRNRIELLSIELEHVLRLADLPTYHKDPFDRLLIAQAQVEGLVLISGDARLADYPVEVVW